jgi:hypothetical protein
MTDDMFPLTYNHTPHGVQRILCVAVCVSAYELSFRPAPLRLRMLAFLAFHVVFLPPHTKVGRL